MYHWQMNGVYACCVSSLHNKTNSVCFGKKYLEPSKKLEASSLRLAHSCIFSLFPRAPKRHWRICFFPTRQPISALSKHVRISFRWTGWCTRWWMNGVRPCYLSTSRHNKRHWVCFEQNIWIHRKKLDASSFDLLTLACSFS